MADLVRMSACPKKSESLDLCSDKFFIHLMDHKSVETQITKVVKQRQHTHTLFQQYRLVACGGTERVVTGLKPFFSSFRNYRTATPLVAPSPTPTAPLHSPPLHSPPLRSSLRRSAQSHRCSARLLRLLLHLHPPL